jgi:1-acyl-sn-glycerol-3-phosphate acyltransferase
MAGKTGAARIALTTRCPVVPMAAWGPQDLLPPYSKRPRLWPRPVMRVTVGDPVDLSDLYDQPLSPQVLHEATERIMDAVTALVAELRGVHPPHRRLDPRAAGLATHGDVHVAYDFSPAAAVDDGEPA